MLIRAIAAFYRSDDEGCRRALELIPPDSAVAHAAKALRWILDGNKPTSGIASALFSRILVDDAPLIAAMQKIETALETVNFPMLQSGIREAVRLCANTRPELLERLRQHISIACLHYEVPTPHHAACRPRVGPAREGPISTASRQSCPGLAVC